MALVTAWSVWVYAQPSTDPRAQRLGPKAIQVFEDGPEHGRAHEEQPEPMNMGDFGSRTPPFVAMLVNFGILVAGYYLVGKKPIAAGLQGRRDRISREIDEAQKMRLEAEVRAKTYQAKLETLDAELVTLREALVQGGQAERDRIVSEASAKADRMRKDAAFLIQQEAKQVRVELQRETVLAAVAAAEELLKKRITPADQERLAEDYLADLGPKTKPAPTPSMRPGESAS
jgi:F-type H+-transporting ATPase subunit b